MYQVVKIMDWTIHGPDNQPRPGYKVTVQDPETGDSFSVESVSDKPEIYGPIIQEKVNRRRDLHMVTFE